ncbi:hypothetical protein GCM10023346_14060 [Arthrobacter gyeryongensis]|uniref:Uncharacterized protein n=1 Tax=Arthrobacter gyeryongensis TaxID=1650592 RepID=A0ABP9S9K5_9MICC
MADTKASEWVTSFLGHVLAFTGKVWIDGTWTIREDCVRMAEARGAVDWKPDMSGRVTLLVHGDLASQHVSDRTRQYSKKLILADSLRRSGKPIAIIDGQGFADLVNGYPARNRKLLFAGPSEVLVLPDLGEGILGGPLSTRQIPAHDPSELTLNLEALDRGTAAHEATVAALSRMLERRGLLPQRPGRHAPAFDLGWTDDDVVNIAEVKSLTGTDETQQIRLGLGQVLDYAQQIRLSGLSSSPVQPVLVLEHEPSHPRWTETASSAGVKLIWGPAFGK